MTVFVTTILKRLLGFATVGAVVFPVELLLTTIFIELFGIPYLVAIALSFILVISAAYRYYRSLSFYNSTQSQWRGYLYFLLLALVGLSVALVGSYYLVSTFALHPTIARGIMGLLTGLCNFTINLVYNFKVLHK